MLVSRSEFRNVLKITSLDKKPHKNRLLLVEYSDGLYWWTIFVCNHSAFAAAVPHKNGAKTNATKLSLLPNRDHRIVPLAIFNAEIYPKQ